MAHPNGWTREQLLIAFDLYCRIPFGKFHSGNPDLQYYGQRIGRSASALAMKLSNIASVDPAFIASGRSGLSGASNSDRAMWVEMESDWDSFSIAVKQAHNFFGDNTDALDAAVEEESLSSDCYSGQDKLTIVKTRVGQQAFRRAVLSAYSGKCCISGVDLPQLLVASHIVPWEAEATNRKNPRNGLCLSIWHDKAFDRGLISLNDDLTVRVSQALRNNQNPFIQQTLTGLEGHSISRPEKFWPDEEFLEYHRERIFVG